MATTKKITVDGHPVTLERRVCTGGCGKCFWVRPDSPARTARTYCHYVCKRGMTFSAEFGLRAAQRAKLAE